MRPARTLRDRLTLWSQTDPIALGDSPEPVVIEINFTGRLRDPIGRSIEQRITELSVIMPSVVSNAASVNRMTGQRARPGLRHVVGQSAVRDFGGCPDAGETRPGKPDQFQVSLYDEAYIRLPLEEIGINERTPRSSEKRLGEGAAGLPCRVENAIGGVGGVEPTPGSTCRRRAAPTWPYRSGEPPGLPGAQPVQAVVCLNLREEVARSRPLLTVPPRGFKHEIELAGSEQLDGPAITQPDIRMGKEI